MEKEPQPDSLSEVTVKQYAPSEVYSSEPPPAYHKPKSSAVQIARIAAITLVAVSVVLGGFILAAAYVNANASCQHLREELELLQEAAERFQASQPEYRQPSLQPEALVQDEPQHRHHSTETHAEQNVDDNVSNNLGEEDSDENTSTEDQDNQEERIHIKLPLQLDLDDIAGAVMNQKSRMNCVVEKKRAEEVVDHQAKTLRLPFGVNLTTDPRYERVTGERMVIMCESGDSEQRQKEQQNQQDDTVMVQPLIIPLPGPAQLPFQFRGQNRPGVQQGQQPTPEIRMQPEIRIIQLSQAEPQESQEQVIRSPHGPPTPHQLPPHPLMQHIARQIIAQHEMAAAAHRQQQMALQQQQEQARQQELSQRHEEFLRHQELLRAQEIARRHAEMMRAQEMAVRHAEMVRAQEAATRQQEMARAQEMQKAQEMAQRAQEMAQRAQVVARIQEMARQANEIGQQEIARAQEAARRYAEMSRRQQQQQQESQGDENQENHVPEAVVMAHRVAIPEEILSQVNRLPNQDVVVQVQESESPESHSQDEEAHAAVAVAAQVHELPMPHQVVQQQRENAREMNGRQTYARGLRPVHIPVPMMQPVHEAPEQEESARPHYVQPRSVRSVDALLRREKRVKRCACDCAC